MTVLASDFRRQPFVVEYRGNGTKPAVNWSHKIAIWSRVISAIVVYATVLVWWFDHQEEGGSRRLLQVYFGKMLLLFLPVALGYAAKELHFQIAGFPASVLLDQVLSLRAIGG